MRDVDVPLSELGQRQAEALGHWFAALPEAERPEVVLTSPYVRAQQTAAAICEAGGVGRRGAKGPVIDERLREREFGLLDRLTTAGVREKFPEQAEQRTLLGKFYHRPPGGESWADVILRLRSALDTVSLHHADRRVLIVCHQVVVLCFRYILEEMDEAQILAIDKEGDVVNCGVCEYEFEPDDEKHCVPRLVRYNFAAPLIEEACAGHLRARRDGRRAMSELEALDREPAAPLPAPPTIPRTATRRIAAGCSSSPAAASWPAPPCSPGSAACGPARASSRSPPPRASPSALGVAIPEARVDRLRGDRGGLHRAAERSRRCCEWAEGAQAIVIGCGLQHGPPLDDLARRLAGERPRHAAGARRGRARLPGAARPRRCAPGAGGAILLPHAARDGAAARMRGRRRSRPTRSPPPAGRRRRFGAVAVIKGQFSYIVAPGRPRLPLRGRRRRPRHVGLGRRARRHRRRPVRARRRSADRGLVGRLPPRRGGAAAGRAGRPDRLPRPRAARRGAAADGRLEPPMPRMERSPSSGSGRARRRPAGRYG